jgi:hypothetical protein
MGAVDTGDRLPFAPLERFLLERFGADANVTAQSTGEERLLTDRRVGELTGVRSRGAVFTWRHNGLDWWVADRMCTRNGWHVADIWPAEHEAKGAA